MGNNARGAEKVLRDDLFLCCLQEVNVDFEAYSMSDSDHDGIKKLLQQVCFTLCTWICSSETTRATDTSSVGLPPACSGFPSPPLPGPGGAAPLSQGEAPRLWGPCPQPLLSACLSVLCPVVLLFRLPIV